MLTYCKSPPASPIDKKVISELDYYGFILPTKLETNSTNLFDYFKYVTCGFSKLQN